MYPVRSIVARRGNRPLQGLGNPLFLMLMVQQQQQAAAAAAKEKAIRDEEERVRAEEEQQRQRALEEQQLRALQLQMQAGIKAGAEQQGGTILGMKPATLLLVGGAAAGAYLMTQGGG